MIKVIALFLLLISFSFSDLKINYSQLDDSTTFGRDLSIKYSIIEADNEVSSLLNYRETPNLKTYKANFSYDIFYDKEISPFFFIGYDNNEYINVNNSSTGAGVSWWIANKQLEFPYCWKVSDALIFENGSLINSFRVKNWGYINKIGWNLTFFHKGYMHDIDLSIKFKIYDNFIIVNQLYYVNSSNLNYFTNSWGVEFKL